MSSNGSRQIVITGMGMTTPVGTGVDAVFDRLCAGQSGIAPIQLLDVTGFGVRFGGEVPDFDPTLHVGKRGARRFDRFALLAVSAAVEAIGQAGIELTEREDGQKRPADLAADSIGTCIGTGVGGLEEIETQYERFREKGPLRVSPFLVPKMMANAAAGQISILFGFQGPNFSTVSACASGGHAIGEAMRTIQRGDAEVMIAGGAEAPITNLALSGFHALRALSTRNDAPEAASRPFDKDRDGFVVAEGAGILVIESLEHARGRDVPILAELAGYGASSDAFHLTEPSRDGVGARRAMERALKDAGMRPDEIPYVNAHGTSTKFNDHTETIALHGCFGDHARKLVINSTKSMTGHTLGAAGAIELAVAVMSIRRGIIHPTINYETPDPDCDLDYCPNASREMAVDAVMSNSFGFGGHNVSLITRTLRD